MRVYGSVQTRSIHIRQQKITNSTQNEMKKGKEWKLTQKKLQEHEKELFIWAFSVCFRLGFVFSLLLLFAVFVEYFRRIFFDSHRENNLNTAQMGNKHLRNQNVSIYELEEMKRSQGIQFALVLFCAFIFAALSAWSGNWNEIRWHEVSHVTCNNIVALGAIFSALFPIKWLILIIISFLSQAHHYRSLILPFLEGLKWEKSFLHVHLQSKGIKNNVCENDRERFR